VIVLPAKEGVASCALAEKASVLVRKAIKMRLVFFIVMDPGDLRPVSSGLLKIASSGEGAEKAYRLRDQSA
jgi:hypothetical protein